MAYYSIFPEKDTTIYSHPDRINLNTGQDEILELVHEHSTSTGFYYPSRILLKWKDSEIKDIFANKLPNPTASYSASIELFAAEHTNVSDTYIISASLVSESWEAGTGRWEATPTSSDGATWIYKKTSSITTPGIDSWDAYFGPQSTGSFYASGDQYNFTNHAGTGFPSGGGNWYFLYGGITEVFDKDNRDIDINVTTAITAISNSYTANNNSYPAAIPNNGFILHKSGRTEQFTASFGELKYFSNETHTIYPPKLTFKWDDSDYHPLITGYPSGNLGGTDGWFITLVNNKKTFQRESKPRFRIAARKRYPDRIFTTSSNFLDEKGYLPTSSYYSIRDAHTDEIIIPFDTEFTKLSADNNGMYFDLFMEGLQPERYYKILFKISGFNDIQVIDDDYHFKIVR